MLANSMSNPKAQIFMVQESTNLFLIANVKSLLYVYDTECTYQEHIFLEVFSNVFQKECLTCIHVDVGREKGLARSMMSIILASVCLH